MGDPGRERQRHLRLRVRGATGDRTDQRRGGNRWATRGLPAACGEHDRRHPGLQRHTAGTRGRSDGARRPSVANRRDRGVTADRPGWPTVRRDRHSIPRRARTASSGRTGCSTSGPGRSSSTKPRSTSRPRTSVRQRRRHVRQHPYGVEAEPVITARIAENGATSAASRSSTSLRPT